MKKILSMYKFMFAGIFSISHFKHALKTDTKKTLGKIVLGFFLVVMLVPSYGMYVLLLKGLIDAFAMLNQIYAVFASLFIGVSFVILFFGMVYVFSAFFSSRDINIFLTLPVKSSQIGAAKMAYLVTTEYILVFLMMTPAVVLLGLNISAGFMFYVYGLILLLTLPIIPISIATVIELGVIKLFGMKVSPEKVQTVFQYVFLALVLAFEFATQKMAANSAGANSSEMISSFINDNMYIFNTAVASYFPAKWAGLAIIGYNTVNGIVNMLLYLALSAAAFMFGVYVVDRLYISSVTSQPINSVSNVKSKKLNLTESTASNKEKTKPAYLAVFFYDLRTILRTQIFAFNTIAITVLMPIILAGTMLSVSGGGEDMGSLYELKAALGAAYTPALFFAIAYISAGLTGMGNVTSSTFSREGKAFWINQVLPIPASAQLIGRCLLPVLLNAAVSLIIGVAAVLFAGFNVLLIIPAVILSEILLFPNCLFGLVRDTVHPLLDWDNPVRAVKQNTNVVFSMLFSMLYLVVCGVLSFFAYAFAGIIAAVAVNVLICGAISFFASAWFLKSVPFRFMK